MATPKGVTDKMVIAAIKKHAAIRSLVAIECGFSQANLSVRLKNSAKLQDAIREVEERQLDLGEGLIIEAMRNKDMATTRWFMERKGKKRGYGNQIQASFVDAQLEAFVAALGGDPAKFRAALAQLGVDPEHP
jgi:hypothetical protein